MRNKIIHQSTTSNVCDLDSFRGRGTTFVSDWRLARVNELERIGSGNFQQYDFQGKISEKVISQSISFVNQLSMLLKAPELGLNADGSILLEWFLKDRSGTKIGSIIIDGKYIIYSILKGDKIESNGATLYTDASVDMVKDLFFKYFEKEINNSQSISR